MRESIGGTMLFWIVLFFMSIFIAFMASIIKYARVYKIKNSMINYIERAEGIFSEEELQDQLRSLGYKTDKYVICRYNPSKIGDSYSGGYYYLKLYATFEIPIVGVSFDVKINGETRTIETGVLINDSGNNSNLFTEKSSDGQCFGKGVSEEEISRGRY